MTTDGHFAAAVRGTGKVAQQAHAVIGREPQPGVAADEITPDLPGFAKYREMPQVVGDSGGGIRTPDTRIMIPLL